MSELDPLPKELEDLFGAERASYTEAPGMRERVRRGVETAIAFSALAGAGRALAPTAAPDPSTAGTTAATTAAGLAAKKVVLIAFAAFVAGGVGGEMHARVTSAPPAVTTSVPTSIAAVAPPPAATATTSEGIPFQNLPTIATPSSSPVAPTPTASATGKDVQSSPLAAEQALIDTARSALSRGRGADALAAADDHAKKFPSGRLGEERENIAIQALLGLGRRDEAKRRAERFHRTYPGSLYGGAIDAVLQRGAPEGGSP
ncbi:MAG: hypothetical protein U0174_25695 [Polyangiaceae bacterium]